MPLVIVHKHFFRCTRPSDTRLLTGNNPDYPTYVAIKGTVFDVSGNKAYGPDGSYKGKSSPDQIPDMTIHFFDNFSNN